jgi:hypothetical protein
VGGTVFVHGGGDRTQPSDSPDARDGDILVHADLWAFDTASRTWTLIDVEWRITHIFFFFFLLLSFFSLSH